MNKITGLLVDVENKKMNRITIEDDLEVFRRILKCKTIDCPTRRIKGVRVIVLCDDCGRLKEEQIPSMIGVSLKKRTLEEIIMGNIFICKADKEGNFASLSDREIKKILSSRTYVGELSDLQPVLVSNFL